MDKDGKIRTVNTIEVQKSTAFHPVAPLNSGKKITSTRGSSSDPFFIIDDSKNILLFNVSKNRISRTIPKKEGKTTLEVFPAKEGFIMIVERDTKEKSTKLSIESL